MGVVLGGRIGYCLFYKPGYYLATHWRFCRVAGWHEFSWWHAGCDRADDLVRLVAQASTFCRWLILWRPVCPPGWRGRVGNFINGELWGRGQP
jgi:phosphatidylglycerol:prolipoprotein diacylglycerol transferase